VRVEVAGRVGYTYYVIIIADAKRRVTMPKSTNPGDAFAIEEMGEGAIPTEPNEEGRWQSKADARRRISGGHNWETDQHGADARSDG
jgi:hypothetical protein